MSLAPLVHLIDDDEAVRDALGLFLRVRGLEVRDYASADAFLATAGPGLAGCVITDVQMPRMTGLELLRRLRDQGLALPLIVMTGRAERHMADEAVRHGAAAFIDKPFDPETMLAAVRGALGQA
jgi:two-component system response regulator FixJ